MGSIARRHDKEIRSSSFARHIQWEWLWIASHENILSVREHRSVVGIRDRDGNRLRGALAFGIRGLNINLIDIVIIDVLSRLKVRRRFKGELAGFRINIKQSRIVAG